MPFEPQGTSGIYDMMYRRPGRGYDRNGKKEIKVRLGDELFAKIRKEAAERGWSVARTIRHLCEAAVDGIE